MTSLDKVTAVVALYLVFLVVVPCLASALCGRTTVPIEQTTEWR